MGQGKQDQQNLVIETPENMEHWEERRMKTIAAFGQRSPKSYVHRTILLDLVPINTLLRETFSDSSRTGVKDP